MTEHSLILFSSIGQAGSASLIGSFDLVDSTKRVFWRETMEVCNADWAYELGRRGLRTISHQPSTASKTITPSRQAATRRRYFVSLPLLFKEQSWLRIGLA